MHGHRTYYDVLGLTPGCSDAEIKDAYRERVKETHPDSHASSHKTSEEFILVKEAMSVIGDPGRRRVYDSSLHDVFGPSDTDYHANTMKRSTAKAAETDHFGQGFNSGQGAKPSSSEGAFNPGASSGGGGSVPFEQSRVYFRSLHQKKIYRTEAERVQRMKMRSTKVHSHGTFGLLLGLPVGVGALWWYGALTQQ